MLHQVPLWVALVGLDKRHLPRQRGPLEEPLINRLNLEDVRRLSLIVNV